MTRIERNKLKKLLHQLVVVRDRECLKCGTRKILHASHIYPKGVYRGVEFDPDNVKALCYKHHIHWWHKNPIEAGEWFKTTYPKWYRKLKKKAETPIGVVKPMLVYDFHKLEEILLKEIKKYEKRNQKEGYGAYRQSSVDL
jgi:hypothetical protein